MASPPSPARALAARHPDSGPAAAIFWGPALAAVGLAAAFAPGCGDDPEAESFLGGGGAPPAGSVYGTPYVPNPPTGGGGAGGGGQGGPLPTGPLPASTATRCPEPFDLTAPALAAVGNLVFRDGALDASLGGVGYRVTAAERCAAPEGGGAGGGAAAGAGGAAGGTGGAAGEGGGAPTGFALAAGLPSPLFAWTALSDGKRVAVTATAVALLPAGGGEPLASCALPDLSARPGRRRAAFDPSDPRHAWVVDGGAELHEVRLVDESEGGPARCETSNLGLTFGEPVALRDVAAGDEPGRLWLAVVAASAAEGSLAQVWRASVAGGAPGVDRRWPERSGPCSAGGLLSADAVAALPGGGVAIADGGCGSVVRFDGSLVPLDRAALPAGDAPRALAADGRLGAAGALFVASAIERLPGARVGLWRVAPRAAD